MFGRKSCGICGNGHLPFPEVAKLIKRMQVNKPE